jgi:ABC-type transporter Mla subunit MlaD
MNSLLVLALVCLIGFVIGLVAHLKKNMTTFTFLISAAIAVAVTISLVAAREQSDFGTGISSLLAFEAHAAKASIGLYALLAILGFGVGQFVKSVLSSQSAP